MPKLNNPIVVAATQGQFTYKSLPVLLGFALVGVVLMTPTFAQTDKHNAVPKITTTDTPVKLHGQINLHSDSRDARSYALVKHNGNEMLFFGDEDDIDTARKLKKKTNADYLWARQGDKTWLINDQEVLAKVEAAWAPANALSAKMDVLSDEMDKHSAVMDTLNDQMQSLTDSSDEFSDEIENLSEQLDDLAREQAQLGRQVGKLSQRLAQADDDAAREQIEKNMAELQTKMDNLDRQMTPISAALDTQTSKHELKLKPLEALSQKMQEASKPMEALGDKMSVLGDQIEQLSEVATQTTFAIIDQALRDNKAVTAEKL